MLLHPDLYRRLRQSAKPPRTSLWKTLRRLRDGHWGGGTRVKRLRGVGRPVYEARTDSGYRLLFTLARAPLSPLTPLDTEPDRMVAHIQIWDWVEHDDAERVARRNRSPEAEFLELDAVEQFAIDEPPPHPEATFAEIHAEEGTSEPLLHFLLPPEDLEIRPAEPESGIRWYLVELEDEEEFQRLFDQGGEELELKLSREQYEILRSPGPVLLAGSAGSGKTTVSVYRLATAVTAAGSALYLSYSPALAEHARRLYRDLAAARGTRGAPEPDFFTFADLYRSLLPKDLADTPEMTEPLFREWFRRSGRPLDPALVWEELRSILKGACLNLAQPMLDEAAYYELGRKRAPLFVDERPEIFRIAQRYQQWLGEEGRLDRIDLCRRAFSELRSRSRTWDVVVCDEVQDLTELEVAFVLALSRRPDLSGVLLSGDTQQTVQPSGFRWAEVRRLAGRLAEKPGHRKETPAVLRLRRNLRSVRPLVELANALLLLRREVFGRTEEDEPEEASVEGPVPVEVPGLEEAVLAAIEGFGPRCAVLTLDDGETERLRQRLGTSRVFHVREAKGLEFDDVVLWKLLAPDADLLERFGRSSQASQGLGEARLDREPRFKRLLQHLYVAVTRARRHLAIHEGPEPHPFWRDRRFRGRLELEKVESLARLFRPTASPGEWEREGDYFLERGHLRQAAECYRRAGSLEKEAKALARADEEREDWTGALTRWAGLRQAARQAPLLERLGRLSEAAACYRQAGLETEARICDTRLLESRKVWKEAASSWESLGRHADAARCWQLASEGLRANLAAARAAEEEGAPGRAGDFWLEAGETEAAARCFRAAGEEGKEALAVARRLEELGHWSRAAAAYRLAGRTQSSARCRARALEDAGRPGPAAVYHERLGETEPAVVLYARAGRWMDVARLEPVQPQGRRRLLLLKLRELIETCEWDEADRLLRARREALLQWLPAIPWFLLTSGERLVWEELRDLERLEHRSRALRAEAERAWSRAARHWTLAEEPGRAAEVRVGRRWRTRLRSSSPSPVAPAAKTPAGHPDRELLRRLVHGTASPDEARGAIRHLLQGCASCGLEVEKERQPPPPSPASYDEAISRIHDKFAKGGMEALQQGSRPPRQLYSELLAHQAVEGLVQVHSTRRYASLALCELLLRKSRELGLDDPGRARKAADLAVRIAEQLDLGIYGAPIVQDVRAMAWAYLAESRRVGAEVHLAESSMERAELLLEGGSGDPLARAELLTLKASLAGYCGRFEEAAGILNRAASIYRRLGDRHLLGRTLLKKGTLLGNAGQHAMALRLIRRSIDLIDPPREPRLIVCATHNLIWFLNESGRTGDADACLDGARRLYERAGDRRHQSRLRWLEGKLAARPREAEGALLSAREGLAREGLAYEAALAAMDLAVLYVQEQRETDMRRQADLIFPLFRSDDMFRETATALQSFQRPAGPEETGRLIDELSDWVERSRNEKNPPALALPP